MKCGTGFCGRHRRSVQATDHTFFLLIEEGRKCNAGEDSKDDHDNQQLHKGEAFFKLVACFLALEQSELQCAVQGGHEIW